MKKKDTLALTSTHIANDEQIVKFIKQTCAEFYSMPQQRVHLKTNKREIVKVRQVAMYLMFVNTKFGPTRISEQYEKDHATAIHAKNTIAGHLTWDRKLIDEVATLQRMIDKKIKMQVGGFENNDEYYYIEMNSFASVKIDEKKAIILTGFTEQEKVDFMIKNEIQNPMRRHENTQMYVLEKK